MYLYVIRAGDTDYYKIGVTKDITKRLRSLQGGNHLRLSIVLTVQHKHAYQQEKHVHQVAKRWHIRGEWFRLPREVVAKIKHCANEEAKEPSQQAKNKTKRPVRKWEDLWPGESIWIATGA